METINLGKERLKFANFSVFLHARNWFFHFLGNSCAVEKHCEHIKWNYYCYWSFSWYISTYRLILGCTSTSTTFNDLWRLDPTTREWSKPLATGAYPSPKACATFVKSKPGQLILFGGKHYIVHSFLGDATYFNTNQILMMFFNYF